MKIDIFFKALLKIKGGMKRCDIAIATVGVKIFPFGTVDHLQVPNDWSVGSRAGLPFRGTRESGVRGWRLGVEGGTGWGGSGPHIHDEH